MREHLPSWRNEAQSHAAMVLRCDAVNLEMLTPSHARPGRGKTFGSPIVTANALSHLPHIHPTRAAG